VGSRYPTTPPEPRSVASRRSMGRESVGGITSLARCTNEESYLVQKVIRARVSARNNVDTLRARVCSLSRPDMV